MATKEDYAALSAIVYNNARTTGGGARLICEPLTRDGGYR